MSYVQANVMYEQLTKLIDRGVDLSEYKVDGCDEFAGEAIIIPMREEYDDE